MADIEVRNGKLVRPGFYRAPDGSGVAYANQIRSSGNECSFCPENFEAHDVKVLEEIGSAAFKFYVVLARPAYAHFDAQEVVGHRLLVPEAHVQRLRDLGDKALSAHDDYIFEQEELYEQRADGVALQSYTRSPTNPSKSIWHLHTHLLDLSPNPLRSSTYDSERGVTDLQFGQLTPEQVAALVASRQTS